MRLDISSLRYLNAADWRVLTAVETGSRNHEYVPLGIIASLANQRSGRPGDIQRSISTLAKIGLIDRGGSRGRSKTATESYRLTYGGLDHLALHSLEKSGAVLGVGNRLGVGKESDIFDVTTTTDVAGQSRRAILKIHRLGRVSFKKGVRRKRDYGKGPRQSGSWMWMSRLAATKEYAFMNALQNAEGISVPQAIAHNRHMVVMEFIDGEVLRSVHEVGSQNSGVGALYADLMAIIVRLAGFGLIHGDFNEFNLILKENVPSEDKQQEIGVHPVVIDFPQMVSVDHQNAEFYFQRDVNCVKTFFERRFRFVGDSSGPTWDEARSSADDVNLRRLDVEVEASGFSRKMAKELETYMTENVPDKDSEDESAPDEEDEHEEDSEDGEAEEDLTNHDNGASVPAEVPAG